MTVVLFIDGTCSVKLCAMCKLKNCTVVSVETRVEARSHSHGIQDWLVYLQC